MADCLRLAELAQAYGLAVVSSCTIAIGASRLVSKGPSFIKRLGVAVPYVAVVTAGAGNVAFTRWPEVPSLPTMMPNVPS